MILRQVLPEDRPALGRLLQRIDNFRPEERIVALELIDDAISHAQDSGYKAIVALASDAPAAATPILGYVCFGRTPMTERAYDLYWIAVDPDFRGRGVGALLVQGVEEKVRRSGGGLIRIETSSQEAYDGTLQFYVAKGYVTVGRIADFYSDKDDLVTLAKRVERSPE